MQLFDFIADDDFRKNLESDYQELDSCVKSKSWKGVLVMAGSIVEAILADALIELDYKKRSGSDPLKMPLSDVIDACHKESIISTKAKELSSVIRSYRNLIHPGRVVRLQETASENEALIAKSLIEIIREEVATKRRDSFGLTATQLLSKIEQDSSSEAIFPHLFAEVNDRERRRLLLDLIPRKAIELEYSERDYFDDYQERENLCTRLHRCYRKALDSASNNIKKEVAEAYVTILRKGADHAVNVYGRYLFKCGDLEHLSKSSIKLVKDHVLARFEADVAENLNLIEGIEPYLTESESMKWIDSITRAIVSHHTSSDTVERISDKTSSGSGQLSKNIKAKVLGRLESWRNHYDEQSMAEAAEKVQKLKLDIEDELPF